MTACSWSCTRPLTFTGADTRNRVPCLPMRVLTAAQMREADRRTIEDVGIPSLVLMENAGGQVVAAIEAIHTDLLDRQVAVLCGRGNNGGDGFVVARTLLQRGVDVSVFLIGQVSDVRGDARVNLDILGRLGVTVVEISDGQAWELHLGEVRDCNPTVDAIFGTGLNAPVRGMIESVITDVNASGIPVVSIDLPSGLSADSCDPIGESIEAGTTVTLAAPKLPLVLPPAENRAGDIVIADIGIPADVLALGPGLGQAPATKQFVKMLVDRATMPLVIDADGLNAFSDDPDRLAGREGRDIIITPHPGEMARLVGMSTDEVQSSRLEIARNFAGAHHVYVVLKGHRTLIATPDGKVFINPTGNPGMATGGAGDVLTGMIAGWLAQLLDAEAACKLAVYLHGMAGDLAEADEGDVTMTAADVAGHLGDAILELSARRKIVERERST